MLFTNAASNIAFIIAVHNTYLYQLIGAKIITQQQNHILHRLYPLLRNLFLAPLYNADI